MDSGAGLLFASLLLSALLVGSQGLDTVPAVVLAAGAAWVTTMALSRRAGRGMTTSVGARDVHSTGSDGDRPKPRIEPS